MMPLAKIEILSGDTFRRRWDGFVEDIGLVEDLARCGDFDVWEVSVMSEVSGCSLVTGIANVLALGFRES